MSTRMLLALAGLLAVTGLALVFWPAPQTGSTDVPPPSASSPPTTSSPSSSVGGMSPDGEDGHDHEDADELVAQRDVVAAFAVAFTAPGDQDDWLTSLKPYVTPDLLDGFTYTAPNQRPTGRAPNITHLEPGDVFQVTYRGGQTIACTVTAAPNGSWVIASVAPVRAPAPTGTDV